MNDSACGISFVVPAYNEEGGIEGTLERLKSVLEALGRPYEIIVVNDGSRDRTPEVVSRIVGVRVVSHPINIGYGNALKTGILQARYEWIGIVDADGSYPVHELPRLVAEMEKGFDMVIARRENLADHDKWLKRLFRRAYIAIISLLTGSKALDPNSGFRLFRREVAEEYFDFLCGAFSFTTSLTVLALERPYFTTFVPVQYQDREGKSKVRHLRDGLRTLQLIAQGVTYYNPIKFFLILAVLLIFLVGFPAMVLAMFRMFTLSWYYMLFGCTVSLMLSIGVLGDIVRISMTRKFRTNTFSGRSCGGGDG